MRLAIIAVVASIMVSAVLPAQAADDTKSGVITLQQLKEGLQYMTAQKEGIAINFILPENWELVEQGIDPKTGKVREDLNVYSLLSRRPVADPKDPTDFIFELDIFKHSLSDDPEKDPKTGKPYTAAEAFKRFLDVQMSVNIKGGLAVDSKPTEIVPKLYGPPTRPKTVLVPIYYKVPNGAMLYTFTSVTGDKVWQVKFLVSEGQSENYGALIALMLDNLFGMTDAEYQKFLQMAKSADKSGGK